MSHFQQHNAVYTSVEEELWCIFTYYSLHFDPTMPEQWKSATFVKFAKDCQIIAAKDCHITSSSSNQLSVPILELEIAKLAKNKYTLEVEKDYNPSSISIDFSDFLSLLSSLSVRIYRHDTMETATRRILLENVLPLANRRTLLSLRYNCRDPDAWKVIKQFNKGLRNIFSYYLSKAEIRRNTWVADQVTLVSKLIGLGSQISPTILEEERRRMNQMKEIAKQQQELISYKEFMQFCQDFSLKSTSFLTALQAADIFLQVVPIDPELKSSKGMSFDAFAEALIYMSQLAYRITPNSSVEHTVHAGNKLKALLLHAWKALNNHDRNNKLLQDHIHVATTVITPSGTHDIFGSGHFSESFLAAWQADNFMEYSITESRTLTSQKSGSKIIHGLTMNESEINSPNFSEGNKISDMDKDHMSFSSLSQLSSLKSGPPSPTQISSKINTTMKESDLDSSFLFQQTDPVVLRSSQLANLFHLRPELAEFIYLELQHENIRK